MGDTIVVPAEVEQSAEQTALLTIKEFVAPAPLSPATVFVGQLRSHLEIYTAAKLSEYAAFEELRGMTVTDSESCKTVSAKIDALRTWSDGIKSDLERACAIGNEIHKLPTGVRSILTGDADALYKAKAAEVLAYNRKVAEENERRRIAAEQEARRIAEEAARKAREEAERKRKEAEAAAAEAARIAREKAEAEAAARASEQSELMPWEVEEVTPAIDPEEAARKAAEEALAAANVIDPEEAARQAQEEARALNPVVVQQVQAPIIGASTRNKPWKHEVYDFNRLIVWVAQNPAERADYLLPNDKMLKVKAGQLKNKLEDAIPGVRGVQEQTLSRR